MKKRILIVQFDAHLTGSAFSGLMLADGLREAGWETIVVFGHEGPMIERYRASSHQVHVIPHKNWIRTNRLLHFIKVASKEFHTAISFEAVIKEHKPDIVYINTSVSFAAAQAARQLGYPVIWHIRELFSDVGGEMKVPFGFKWLIQLIFRTYSTQLVTISKAVSSNMLGKEVKKVHIVPNAVSTSFFNDVPDRKHARKKFDLSQNGRIIGVPGTLRPMKGHPFFLHAVAPLLDAHPDLFIAITGDGEDKYVRELKELVDALHIGARTRFLGSIDDMPSFYRACDVVCIPSVAEPFGRTVIEAFATGVPVVATDVGGIKEIVDHEKNGLLIPYGNQEALTTALMRILDDKDLSDRLSTSARQKAESHYHESSYKSRICQIVAAISGIRDERELALIS